MNLPGGIVLWWVLTGQAQEGTAPEAEAPQVLLSARVLGGLPGAAVSPGWRWEDFFCPNILWCLMLLEFSNRSNHIYIF